MIGAESEEGAVGFAINTAVNPANLDKKITLKDGFVISAFGMLVLPRQKERMMMLDCTLWVITQAPYPEDQVNLPNGLFVLSTYTQLNPGSHKVVVVIWNGMSQVICMSGGCQIGQVIMANAIPNPHASLELLKKLRDEESFPTPGLTTVE